MLMVEDGAGLIVVDIVLEEIPAAANPNLDAYVL
jgi:hypothetical protein